MSNLRAELRRIEAANEKLKRSSKKTPLELAMLATEANRSYMELWQRNKADEVVRRLGPVIMQYEDTIALINFIAALKAIYKTWGFTKSMRRFVDNFNAAVIEIENDFAGEVEFINQISGCSFSVGDADMEAIDVARTLEKKDISGFIRFFDEYRDEKSRSELS